MAIPKIFKNIAKAIKALDEDIATSVNVGSKDNKIRVDESRARLFNILVTNGYELEIGTHKVIPSKTIRPLMPEDHKNG